MGDPQRRLTLTKQRCLGVARQPMKVPVEARRGDAVTDEVHDGRLTTESEDTCVRTIPANTCLRRTTRASPNCPRSP
jgi:hypothetical protein